MSADLTTFLAVTAAGTLTLAAAWLIGRWRGAEAILDGIDAALDQPCGCEDGDCWWDAARTADPDEATAIRAAVDRITADVIAHAETITRQAARDQAIIDTAEGDL